MSFLTRTPGMTKREASEIVELHELVQHSLLHGPVELCTYVSIRRVKASSPESAERNLRRLVARVRELGFLVEAKGDGESLTLDFSHDDALRGELERVIDKAVEACSSNTVQLEDDPEECVPVDALVTDQKLGLTERSLARRYGIGREHVRAILHAKGCARDAGPLRVEERRCADVLAKALADPTGYGHVTRVARVLGCHRNTARALLRRLRGPAQRRVTENSDPCAHAEEEEDSA